MAWLGDGDDRVEMSIGIIQLCGLGSLYEGGLDSFYIAPFFSVDVDEQDVARDLVGDSVEFKQALQRV